MDQRWFEMVDIRRRKLNSAVWIPLRASQSLGRTGTRGHAGYREEFLGAASIAVPLKKRAEAQTLGWRELGLMHSHKGYLEDGRYVPADVFKWYRVKWNGTALVLAQDGNSDEPPEWHLHQDFVITLGLKREGDTWLSLDEGYIEVARLTKDNGQPVLLEVRAEHLKDYLCARGMALRVSSYMSREETVSDASHIDWPESPFEQISEDSRWEGRKTEMHEGGHPFGSSMAVFHLGRENIDPLEDVPHVGPFDENITSKSWTVPFKGRKLIRLHGELWCNEWVEPSKHSPRVREDRLPSETFFITDAQGTRSSADNLEATGGWLWFRPEVVQALLRWRGAGLQWYTRDTGGVRCSPSTSYVHFGINRLGLICVFAKDIGHLAQWMQTIWAGFNVGPEGGVSEELLAAQAEGNPADTQAPEEFLPRVFGLLNEATSRKFGFLLFRAHDQFQTLVTRAHRFRSTDEASFFSLAKDLARLTADGIDAAAIQRKVAPPKGTEWRSLKSLEELVALKAGPTDAHAILGPLVGIYQLRHVDAHLPGSDTADALPLTKVDPKAPFVIQGFQLLHSCVSSLYSILEVLNHFPDSAS